MKPNIQNSIGILSIVVVFIFSNILAGSIVMEYFSELSNGVIAFISYCLSALLTIIYMYAVKRAFGIYVPSLRPEIRKLNPRLIVLGFILILAMNMVLSPLQDLMPEKYIDILDRYMNNGLWAMAVAVILAPIYEEFLFRGAVQTNLIHSYGAITGIILGAVIFGAMHVIPQQMLGAFGVGLILGAIYHITGSLNTVVAIHFINNGFTYLLFMLFSNTNQLEKLLMEDYTMGVIAYSIAIIILILGGAYVIKWTKREKAATHMQNSRKN